MTHEVNCYLSHERWEVLHQIDAKIGLLENNTLWRWVHTEAIADRIYRFKTKDWRGVLNE